MALCIACGRKATLSIYSRILSAEITLCRECVLQDKAEENKATAPDYGYGTFPAH